MASSGDKGEAFSFTSDTLDNILKEIKRPGIKKSTQESDTYKNNNALSKSHCRLLEKKT